MSNEELVRALEQARAGVLVFAASNGVSESKERADWGHGAFTKAILESLQGDTTPTDEKKFDRSRLYQLRLETRQRINQWQAKTHRAEHDWF